MPPPSLPPLGGGANLGPPPTGEGWEGGLGLGGFSDSFSDRERVDSIWQRVPSDRERVDSI